MNKISIQQQIVSRFWSESLKKHIAQTGHVFSDEELLGLVWNFVPEYQERLRLFGLIAEHIPAVSEHARLCMVYMEETLTQFQQHDPHTVFELHIKDTPDSWDERYLCATYEATLEMIDGFHKEYGTDETEQTQYTIVKRCILQAGEQFQEDCLGTCELGPGKVLYNTDRADNDGREHAPCEGFCLECKNRCAAGMDVVFPDFIPNLSAVKYRYIDHKTEYGLYFAPFSGSLLQSCYLLPLDSDMVKYRRFNDDWDHNHVPHPFVDVITAEALPDELKDGYYALKAYLEYQLKIRENMAGASPRPTI